MSEESIALTGQRKLTKEQEKVINEHHQAERDKRKWMEAEQRKKKSKESAQ